MYWAKIENNNVLTSPSFLSFMLVDKTIPSEQTDRQRYSIGHPSIIAEVETTVELGELVLQIS
jgi:hypothetical protein